MKSVYRHNVVFQQLLLLYTRTQIGCPFMSLAARETSASFMSHANGYFRLISSIISHRLDLLVTPGVGLDTAFLSTQFPPSSTPFLLLRWRILFSVVLYERLLAQMAVHPDNTSHTLGPGPYFESQVVWPPLGRDIPLNYQFYGLHFSSSG